MPLPDVFLTIRAIASAVDHAAAPARAVNDVVNRMIAPLRAVQTACKLDLPQLPNPMEMK